MYLDNKYTKWYYNITKSAQMRLAPKGYIEKHHIIPKCMGAGKETILLHWQLNAI